LHALTLAEGAAPRDALREAHDRVLASGPAEVLTEEELRGQWSEVSQAAAPSSLTSDFCALTSALVLPLRARGRTLGVLVLGCADGRPAPDLALAEDLASRAAVALDNARLYRDIQENDRRKNEFLAMLGHELRNPLAPIRTAVEFLRRHQVMGPELSAARDIIDRQVQLMVRLV